MSTEKPFLIGIAGPSGSGKSTLARLVAERLPDCSLLSLDAYYRDRPDLDVTERAKLNFDHPDALDDLLLEQQVAALARGEPVAVPEYRFETHTRAPGGRRLVPGRFVVVEGILAFHFPNVRRHLRLKVFCDAPDAVCLARRTERDVRNRGRTAASVHEQFEQTVLPMCDRYVRPTRQHADLRVSGEDPIEANTAAVLARLARKGDRSVF